VSNRLYVVGLGFSGLEIAQRAKQAGWSVAGSVTTAEKAARLTAEEGIDAEVLSPDSVRLRAATHLVSTVAPDASGDPVLPLVRHVPVKWLGYLSTTGVYGDRGGGWVDESDEPRPGQMRSKWRLDAERDWQSLGRKANVPVAVFRLPAIYGPGRSALDQVLGGRANCVDKPGQMFSRVHTHDIASAVLAAMNTNVAGTFNVCDDEPCPQHEVIAFACKLLGRSPPTLVPWTEAAPKMSEMARSFYEENRRVKNERIKRELGVALKFPTYRDGLSAIAAQRKQP
jgi:nucleoside-diphosphate-sugar epimerase